MVVSVMTRRVPASAGVPARSADATRNPCLRASVLILSRVLRLLRTSTAEPLPPPGERQYTPGIVKIVTMLMLMFALAFAASAHDIPADVTSTLS